VIIMIVGLVVIVGDEVTEAPATDPPETISEESKRLALFIVLPLFLCCYGGSCIIYCVHKIIRNCARAKRGPAPPPEEVKPPTVVPVVVGHPPVGAREKKPMNGAKVAPYVYTKASLSLDRRHAE